MYSTSTQFRAANATFSWKGPLNFMKNYSFGSRSQGSGLRTFLSAGEAVQLLVQRHGETTSELSWTPNDVQLPLRKSRPILPVIRMYRNEYHAGIPNPGSFTAFRAGCTCDMLLNQFGVGSDMSGS